MRQLFLVGESLPESSAVTFGNGSALNVLDDRHGVFPNLVMSPLLALLWAHHEQSEHSPELWRQVNEILTNTERRFNVFTKHVDADHPRKPEFEIHADTKKNLTILMSNPKEYLWALFGFQTTFGLIRWILRCETRVQKKEIRDFAGAFVLSAAKRWRPQIGVPSVTPENVKRMNKCAMTGYVHRLCTHHDADGSGVVTMLRCAIQENTTQPSKVEDHLSVFRAFVPLLHNEAYQMSPHGIGQANFVLATNFDHSGSQALDDLYWKVMGRCLIRRISAPTVH